MPYALDRPCTAHRMFLPPEGACWRQSREVLASPFGYNCVIAVTNELSAESQGGRHGQMRREARSLASWTGDDTHGRSQDQTEWVEFGYGWNKIELQSSSDLNRQTSKKTTCFRRVAVSMSETNKKTDVLMFLMVNNRRLFLSA